MDVSVNDSTSASTIALVISGDVAQIIMTVGDDTSPDYRAILTLGSGDAVTLARDLLQAVLVMSTIPPTMIDTSTTPPED
jgi:hypothetical protein